jgi:hypothetical protein
MTTFTVQYKRQVLRVRLLEDPASVHKLFKTTDRPKRGFIIQAFFAPNKTNANGTIVLPLVGCTPGLVAHEVMHAQAHRERIEAAMFKDFHPAFDFAAYDEEEICTRVGDLVDCIWSRVEKARAEVGL